VAAINAKHPFNAADHAADSSTHNGAHGASNPIPFIEAMSGAARNATLGLSDNWQGERGETSRADQKGRFHERRPSG
jgi:hypothetical protein